VLAIRAARAARSITVTRSELRVGEGLPRGTVGLPLLLADEATVMVPTRHPQELRATLEVGATMPEIRVADEHERPELVEIERRSETLVSVAGIGPLPDPAAGHETVDQAVLLLVAGRPAVGFARVDEVDGH